MTSYNLINGEHACSTKDIQTYTLRKKMDKKPHYKQSSIIFLLIGIIFLLNAMDTILKTGWLFYVILTVIFIVIIYAIVFVLIYNHFMWTE